MQRIANPSSPVRLWVAPPKFLIGIKKIAPSGAIFVCAGLSLSFGFKRTG
jgi:hypothetical protein